MPAVKYVTWRLYKCITIADVLALSVTVRLELVAKHLVHFPCCAAVCTTRSTYAAHCVATNHPARNAASPSRKRPPPSNVPSLVPSRTLQHRSCTLALLCTSVEADRMRSCHASRYTDALPARVALAHPPERGLVWTYIPLTWLLLPLIPVISGYWRTYYSHATLSRPREHCASATVSIG